MEIQIFFQSSKIDFILRLENQQLSIEQYPADRLPSSKKASGAYWAERRRSLARALFVEPKLRARFQVYLQ